ncbi:MAG: hypothetical protein DDT19_02357 [Syntrophomonadaceae bacterium]|nr:hypothetical protein [Bacillota bacterium]
MAHLKSSGQHGKQRADSVVEFFKAELRHTKGRWAGRPFELLPWQEKIVRDLFGTLRSDGTRQYRTAFIAVPRKSGKSTLAAAIGLALLFEGEQGGEVYSAAVDRDQAAIVFETAKAMVEASPRLRQETQVFRRALYVPRFGATYKVLSADAPGKHGLNAHGIIFDELHAQPNRDLWDVLTTSVGAREQPLIIVITTAGYNQTSICYELYDYAKKIRDGIIRDDTFYTTIYEAAEDDDWTSEETWRKANPSLGTTVLAEFYAQESRKAHEMPSYQNTFRRLYLNQWVQQQSRWIDLALWDENGAQIIDERSLHGRTCFGGLDLSAVADLTAWVMVFPHDDDPEIIDVLCRFWCPEARLYDTSNKYRYQYQAWAKQGYLKTTPGDAIDYAFIKTQILQDAQKFQLVDLNIDRVFQGYQLGMELQEEGLIVVGMGQGFLSMALPMKEFERRLLARKVRHGGNPVLRFMADSVVVKQDAAGNLKPDKANSQARIDGIVALVMALDRSMRREKLQRSIYESQGLDVL